MRLKSPANEPPANGSLQRVLGGIFAVSVVIGTAVGGGILYTPGVIAKLVPNPTYYMALWAFGGINSLLGATVFAELGAMIPLSGGPYSFSRRALGEYAGFFVGYTQWILYCAASAGLLLLAGEYVYALLPQFTEHKVLFAFIALLVATLLHWHSVREGGRIQVITTVAKTMALLALVVAAFVVPHAGVAAAGPGGSAGVTGMVALILAMQGVIYTYDSYYCSVFFSEEVRDPGREVPRAIFRGVAVITAIYLLLNAAFLWVLPIGKMADEPFVGGAVAGVLFGIHGEQVIRLIVIVSVLGTINALVLMTARILLTMGRDGLFAHHATRINAGGSPTAALLLSSLVTAAFLLSGTFGAVLGVVALLMAINYLLTYLSLVVLRRREPQTPRPYRAWGYPWTTAIAILIGIVFVGGVALNDRKNTVIAAVILAISYPVYLGTRRLFRGAN